MKTAKKITKIVLLLALGALLAYGFMWWQVYRKFDIVWTCQVFTGHLSIEEQPRCTKYKQQIQNGEKPKYY